MLQGHNHPIMMSNRQKQLISALTEKRYFKLIMGASFSEPQTIECLTQIYSDAGADCIDIGADPVALHAALKGLEQSVHPETPLMVSLDVDGDPHFRKVVVDDPACILCGACVPVCPTEALTLEPTKLLVDDPLCYGCMRCTEICPTDAFHTKSVSQLAEPLKAVLTHPRVDAVELHSNQMNPGAWQLFLHQMGPYLTGKVISICFRPGASVSLPAIQAVFEQVETWMRQQTFYPPGLMLQIDGLPMSGSSHPEASLPAIKGAQWFLKQFGTEYPITLSGGINPHTAHYLSQPENDFIAGVGMGTMARQWVWEDREVPHQAVQKAKQLVELFQKPRSSLPGQTFLSTLPTAELLGV